MYIGDVHRHASETAASVASEFIQFFPDEVSVIADFGGRIHVEATSDNQSWDIFAHGDDAWSDSLVHSASRLSLVKTIIYIRSYLPIFRFRDVNYPKLLVYRAAPHNIQRRMENFLPVSLEIPMTWDQHGFHEVACYPFLRTDPYRIRLRNENDAVMARMFSS